RRCAGAGRGTSSLDRKSNRACPACGGCAHRGETPADLGRIGQTVLRRDREGRMSFSAGWLTLREPYDRRARNAAVLGAVAAWAAQRQSVSVVDLACGLGSTLRSVTERLPKRQSW